jgi:transcriptional regulator with XRE-family HTH domain
MELVLRQERRKRGWSQDYVAGKIGISRVAVQQFEAGETKPSFAVLVKLLDLFDCNDPRILFGAATPNKKPDGNQANM